MLPWRRIGALPGDQGRRLEQELGDQADLGVGLPGIGELLLERGRGAGRAELALAFGMAGQADDPDAVALEQAGVEQRLGSGERAARQVDAAADRQNLFDPGLGGDPPQVVLELGAIADRPRRKMRHRHQSFGAEPRRGPRHLAMVLARQVSDVDPGARG